MSYWEIREEHDGYDRDGFGMRSEYDRKPWLFATLVGATPVLIGLVLWDYFFLLSGMLALCFWLVLSILFLFEYGQGLDK